MKRLFTAAAVAILAVVGLAGPAQAASSCTTYNYADGVAMFRVCDSNYIDLADNSWISYQRSIWNPDLAHGGHSGDAIFKFCMFNVAADCAGTATDGATIFSNSTHTLNDAATMWMCVQVVATWTGSTVVYNRQVSFNRTGAVSVTVTATCGPGTA